MEWYLLALKRYGDFSARSRRREYWMFFLINFVVAIGLAVVEGLVGIAFVSLLYSLAVLIPGIAVTIRRLHDTGRSGWWMLIGLIPLIGTIVLLVFLVQDSEPGENRFGPNPKVVPAFA